MSKRLANKKKRSIMRKQIDVADVFIMQKPEEAKGSLGFS